MKCKLGGFFFPVVCSSSVLSFLNYFLSAHYLPNSQLDNGLLPVPCLLSEIACLKPVIPKLQSDDFN